MPGVGGGMFGGAGFPGIGPTPGSTMLDQPPPSPTPMGGLPSGAPFSMRGIAGSIPSNQMPPEVLTGITSALSQVSSTLDSVAQVAPDQAAQLAMVKDILQQVSANLMSSGAGPVSPTAAGPAPPMGGFDRGISGAGAV